MKLSKREKIMVTVLIALLMIYGYLRFLIIPTYETLEVINEGIGGYKVEVANMKDIVASEEVINAKYEELQEELHRHTATYFPTTDQDYLIMQLSNIIENSNIEISSISFSQPRREEIMENSYDIIATNLPFKGDYEILISFLREIRQHEKTIVVKDLSIQNNTNNILEGNIVLEFYGLEEHSLSRENIIERFFDGFHQTDNPFAPFEGYVEDIYEVLNEYDGDYSHSEETNQGRENTTVIRESFPEEKIHTFILEDFEHNNTFFVGNPKEVKGQISRDANSKVGNTSIRLEYDFIWPRVNSRGNIVLQGEKAIIERQPKHIGLWVYTWEESDHSIGAVLVDDNGREHDITFVSAVDWKGWKYLEGSPPVSTTYPAKLQRLYIESSNYDQKTKGVVLLDAVEVAYRDALPYVTRRIDANENYYVTYQVQQGDTIFSISNHFYGNYSNRFAILRQNNIESPHEIYVGQTLKIPNVGNDVTGNQVTAQENNDPMDYQYYVVQPGDTIFSISKAFYNDYNKRHIIMEYNNITNSNYIEVGSILKFPNL